MQFLGLRVDDGLYEEVRKHASSSGKTISAYVRSLLEHAVKYKPAMTAGWHVIAWNVLGIDALKFRYAIRSSTSADEFFSMVSRWISAPLSSIKVIPSKAKLVVEFKAGGNTYLLSTPRTSAKEDMIEEIIRKLESKIVEVYEDAPDGI